MKITRNMKLLLIIILGCIIIGYIVCKMNNKVIEGIVVTGANGEVKKYTDAALAAPTMPGVSTHGPGVKDFYKKGPINSIIMHMYGSSDTKSNAEFELRILDDSAKFPTITGNLVDSTRNGRSNAKYMGPVILTMDRHDSLANSSKLSYNALQRSFYHANLKNQLLVNNLKYKVKNNHKDEQLYGPIILWSHVSRILYIGKAARGDETDWYNDPTYKVGYQKASNNTLLYAVLIQSLSVIRSPQIIHKIVASYLYVDLQQGGVYGKGGTAANNGDTWLWRTMPSENSAKRVRVINNIINKLNMLVLIHGGNINDKLPKLPSSIPQSDYLMIYVTNKYSIFEQIIYYTQNTGDKKNKELQTKLGSSWSNMAIIKPGIKRVVNKQTELINTLGLPWTNDPVQTAAGNYYIIKNVNFTAGSVKPLVFPDPPNGDDNSSFIAAINSITNEFTKSITTLNIGKPNEAVFIKLQKATKPEDAPKFQYYKFVMKPLNTKNSSGAPEIAPGSGVIIIKKAATDVITNVVPQDQSQMKELLKQQYLKTNKTLTQYAAATATARPWLSKTQRGATVIDYNIFSKLFITDKIGDSTREQTFWGIKPTINTASEPNLSNILTYDTTATSSLKQTDQAYIKNGAAWIQKFTKTGASNTRNKQDIIDLKKELFSELAGNKCNYTGPFLKINIYKIKKNATIKFLAMPLTPINIKYLFTQDAKYGFYCKDLKNDKQLYLILFKDEVKGPAKSALCKANTVLQNALISLNSNKLYGQPILKKESKIEWDSIIKQTPPPQIFGSPAPTTDIKSPFYPPKDFFLKLQDKSGKNTPTTVTLKLHKVNLSKIKATKKNKVYYVIDKTELYAKDGSQYMLAKNSSNGWKFTCSIQYEITPEIIKVFFNYLKSASSNSISNDINDNLWRQYPMGTVKSLQSRDNLKYLTSSNLIEYLTVKRTGLYEKILIIDYINKLLKAPGKHQITIDQKRGGSGDGEYMTYTLNLGQFKAGSIDKVISYKNYNFTYKKGKENIVLTNSSIKLNFSALGWTAAKPSVDVPVVAMKFGDFFMLSTPLMTKKNGKDQVVLKVGQTIDFAQLVLTKVIENNVCSLPVLPATNKKDGQSINIKTMKDNSTVVNNTEYEKLFGCVDYTAKYTSDSSKCESQSWLTKETNKCNATNKDQLSYKGILQWKLINESCIPPTNTTGIDKYITPKGTPPWTSQGGDKIAKKCSDSNVITSTYKDDVIQLNSRIKKTEDNVKQLTIKTTNEVVNTRLLYYIMKIKNRVTEILMNQEKGYTLNNCANINKVGYITTSSTSTTTLYSKINEEITGDTKLTKQGQAKIKKDIRGIFFNSSNSNVSNTQLTNASNSCYNAKAGVSNNEKNRDFIKYMNNFLNELIMKANTLTGTEFDNIHTNFTKQNELNSQFNKTDLSLLKSQGNIKKLVDSNKSEQNSRLSDHQKGKDMRPFGSTHAYPIDGVDRKKIQQSWYNILKNTRLENLTVSNKVRLLTEVSFCPIKNCSKSEKSKWLKLNKWIPPTTARPILINEKHKNQSELLEALDNNIISWVNLYEKTPLKKKGGSSIIDNVSQSYLTTLNDAFNIFNKKETDGDSNTSQQIYATTPKKVTVKTAPKTESKPGSIFDSELINNVTSF